MKDIKIARFVELIINGKSAIEAMKKADIDYYTLDEVLKELSKEEYSSNWDKLAKVIMGKCI